MARKYKRSTRAGSSTRQATPANLTTQPETGSSPFTRKTSDFNPDYSHVIKDLKRIGTLAGSFLVILVVLSFFLN